MPKQLLALVLLLFFYSTLLGQANKNGVNLSSGDTIIVPSFRNGKVIKEEYYLSDQLVLKKKYYYKKNSYGYLIKDPRAANKKAIIIKDYWLNGKVRIDGTSLDGKNPEGSYKTFHKNGQPQCICNYKNGKRDGLQLFYFDNGQRGSQIIYANGVPWSIIENYTKDGKVFQEGTLKDGNGTFIRYNAREKPSRVEYYKSGVLVKTEKFNKSNHLKSNKYGTIMP